MVQVFASLLQAEAALLQRDVRFRDLKPGGLDLRRLRPGGGSLQRLLRTRHRGAGGDGPVIRRGFRFNRGSSRGLSSLPGCRVSAVLESLVAARQQ